MKVIVFAATKGGTGKTTLCWNTALYATRDHKVLLTDMDPQKSLTEQFDKRGELFNPRSISNIENVGKTARLLREAGYGHDYFFIDTPGSLLPIIEDACAAADLIVLPVQTSATDLTSQEALFNTIDNMGMAHRTMFVLNRVEGGRSDLKQKALDYLNVRTRVPIPIIMSRADYQRAGWKGEAAWEVNKNKTVENEIGRLWKAIKQNLAMSARPKERINEQPRLH